MSYRREFVDMAWDGTCEFAHFNQTARNDGSGGYGETREWQHVARIPTMLVRNWEIEMGLPADFLLSKEGFSMLLAKIKDRDFSNLRTDK